MYEILLVVYLLAAVAVVGLVLVQQGKGAEMGASFGSGASNTVFGSSGSGNFLSRATALFATLFFILSLVLGNMTAKQTKSSGEFDNLTLPAKEQVQENVVSTENSNDIPK